MLALLVVYTYWWVVCDDAVAVPSYVGLTVAVPPYIGLTVAVPPCVVWVSSA